MSPEKALELIEPHLKNLPDHKVALVNRLKHRLAHRQEILGKERVQLGKLYRDLIGSWPFEDSQQDLDRRQNNAGFLSSIFEDAIESGVLDSLSSSEKGFITRIKQMTDNREQVEKKDFNFLYHLSKKYEKQLVAFMPNPTKGAE